MRRSAILAVLGLGLAGASPGGAADAPAPRLHTDQPCYLQHTAVHIDGSGFLPGARYTVTLDRRELGSASVKPDGSVSGTLPSGALHHAHTVSRSRIQVFDGQNQGRAAFDLTAFTAGFQPATGNPRTLKVRFTVLGIGLGLGAPGGDVVYVHYLSPTGHLKGTAPIGRTSGACGSLRGGALHRLFPFRAQSGVWRLQFDLRAHYSSAASPRIVRSVTVSR